MDIEQFQKRHPSAQKIPGMVEILNDARGLRKKAPLPETADIYQVTSAMDREEERQIYALFNPVKPDEEPSYSIGFLAFVGSRPVLTWEQVQARMGN